ncbi:methyltransferase domain-containing protein [Venatoribacter cucullus]|uniref:Methyltransferase domain-containing protein n=1 Tax=Venatoribacter cucullus TaxID=2661630 RepID=A0A9X7UVN6_9GAMM|nr:class I SAM-dependent methyltransferase [Venatoribacter cucullus]QQD23733.1 methyltransferase domain-containing protein [Venatoribacter cucullus]
MIPTWLQVPSLAEWEKKKLNPEFSDSRDVGLKDAVRAGWYQNDQNELFRGFPISAGDTVVDVGCGAGGATLFCARTGAHVVYCDIGQDSIDRLTEKVKETPARSHQGVVTNCMPLPLESNLATRVISMEMLEHVDDPAAVMAELARIGKPGALYLISVPDAASENLQKPFAPPEYFQKPNHIHIFSKEKLANLVTEAGLEVIDHTGYGFFWNIWICLLWACDKAAKTPARETSHNGVQPPFYPILDDWASIWDRLISLPEAEPIRKALDEALPKSQIVIARKP